MRYVLNFNPEGTTLVGPGDSIEFVKLPKALTNGTTTKLRVSDSAVLPFTRRDANGARFGTILNQATAKSVGIKGSQRYTLQKSGNKGWFNLVPHSRIGKKARRIGEPGVSVALIER